MFNSRKRKMERLNQITLDSISTKSYNLILGGVLLYGFVMNAIMVLVAQNFMLGLVETISLIGFLIAYIVCAIAGSIIIRYGASLDTT